MSQHGCPERLSNRSKGFPDEGASQPTMEVLVETLTGTAFEMTVSPSDTIFDIKSKICRVEGIPVSQQHLLYNLKELEDGASLVSAGVTDGARLRLVLGMRGGPISTRRLPPPPGEPWRDIERLLDTAREDGDWSGSSSGGGGGGCKVTVLVFRDGERVNMLRVRENRDGSYSPIDHAKYSSSLTHLPEQESEEAAGALRQNAVTMGKMLELRRRMESMSVRRRSHQPTGDKVEIQKTRSEETLSVPSLLDEAGDFPSRTYTPYSEAEDTFTPLYDGHYTRYDYDCSFADRYTLLPPIAARTDSDQSVHDAADTDRLKLSDALAGSILVKGRRDTREDEAAILEECLDASAVEECHIRQDSPQLAAKNLAPIPAAEYGPLVGGESGGWRVRGFGSSSQLVPPGSASSHSHSASSLHLPARAPPPPRHHPPLSDALFSSSTSDLEKLKRNSRILPALSRHRNREHLHLSDEGLHLSPAPPPRPRHLDLPSERRLDVASERRLDVASERSLEGASERRLETHLAAHTERRQRRIEKIAEMDTSRLYRFDDTRRDEPTDRDTKEKKLRVRCGLCRKKLSIATVHRCRCGAEFCAPHRYAEVHGCAYDYKAHAADTLQRANPLVSAPKLPKI